MQFSSSFFIAVFCTICSCASSQQNTTVINTYAFSKVQKPGIVPVMPGENKTFVPDTIIDVYAEIKGGAPTWQYAWRNSKQYAITAMPLAEGTVQVTVNSITKKPIILKAGTGNKWWLLSLEELGKRSKPPIKISNGEIALIAILKGKKIIKKTGVTNLPENEPVQ